MKAAGRSALRERINYGDKPDEEDIREDWNKGLSVKAEYPKDYENRSGVASRKGQSVKADPGVDQEYDVKIEALIEKLRHMKSKQSVEDVEMIAAKQKELSDLKKELNNASMQEDQERLQKRMLETQTELQQLQKKQRRSRAAQ